MALLYLRGIMDLTFKTDEGIFNCRVCAVFLHEGKLLVIGGEQPPYYYLPGGRVQLQEPMEEAVLREVREELGIEAKIIRPLWLNQGFFVEDVTGERFHELCLYFLMDASDTDLFSRGDVFERREGKKSHIFYWLPVDSLEEEYLYPVFIRKQILQLPENLTLQAEFE